MEDPHLKPPIPGLVKMETVAHGSRYVLCIEGKDSDDLEEGKIYRCVPDEDGLQKRILARR
jgi:hypothetical protein